jgi:hypothetical protein
MKKNILVLIFSLVGVFLFASDIELGVWEFYAPKDRFGDPTGKSQYSQFVLGEGIDSTGRKSSQIVGIIYSSNREIVVGIVLFGDFPLYRALFGPELITLYIKDLANRTYSFIGMQSLSEVVGNAHTTVILVNNDTSLFNLLRQKGSYKAVIEGKHWSCSFTFNGGLPQ